jgi:hypothetical protein
MESQKSKRNFQKDDAADIFQLLKSIKISEKNRELLAYFKFVKFYGLLDPLNSAKFDEAISKKFQSDLTVLKYFSILLAISYFFYRKSYTRAFLSIISFGTIFGYSYIYFIDKEFNYVMLQMKDDYINKVDRFFKEGKNPLILNPDFLNEDLIDPNLTAYQNLLKMSSNNQI